MTTTTKSSPILRDIRLRNSSTAASGGEIQTEEANRPALVDRLAGSRLVGVSSVVFAALQAICPAVVAVSAVRVLLGLGALAAAGTDLTDSAWHQNWIRIPMLAIAAGGALLNLFVIWHVRRLRQRPAAQWRVSPATPAKLRSERLQISLAVVTFVLIAAEIYVHHS